MFETPVHEQSRIAQIRDKIVQLIADGEYVRSVQVEATYLGEKRLRNMTSENACVFVRTSETDAEVRLPNAIQRTRYELAQTYEVIVTGKLAGETTAAADELLLLTEQIDAELSRQSNATLTYSEAGDKAQWLNSQIQPILDNDQGNTHGIVGFGIVVNYLYQRPRL